MVKKILILIIIPAFFFFVGYYLSGKIFKTDQGGSVLSYFTVNIFSSPTPTPTETPIPTNTPTPTSTPSPTPTPSPTSTPTPSPTPSPTPIPQPKVTSEQIQGFMERFAGQYGVDVNVLRAVAVCESGFNPNAVNGPYAGLFQFDKTTWKNNRIPMGESTDPDLRFNAEEATQTAAYLISKGKSYLWPNCYP